VCTITYTEYVRLSDLNLPVGFAPTGEFDVSVLGEWSCEFCSQCPGASALQTDDSSSLNLASLDGDFEQEIALAMPRWPQRTSTVS
jgi:hypothetical protein